MSVTALIDGDVVAYRAAAAVQQSYFDGVCVYASLDDAIQCADDILDAIHSQVGASKLELALTDSGMNYRKDILQSYKANRTDKVKPKLLGAVKDYLTQQYGARTKPRLEADDVLGIMATHPRWTGTKIIVTVDKDLKQIPGLFYDFTKAEGVEPISHQNGDALFYRQVLTGDVVDNYKGCPKIGPVKAGRILDGLSDPKEIWAAIVSTYERAGLTEDDALQQARVARILRNGEYDFLRNQPILWSPPN